MSANGEAVSGCDLVDIVAHRERHTAAVAVVVERGSEGPHWPGFLIANGAELAIIHFVFLSVDVCEYEMVHAPATQGWRGGRGREAAARCAARYPWAAALRMRYSLAQDTKKKNEPGFQEPPGSFICQRGLPHRALAWPSTAVLVIFRPLGPWCFLMGLYGLGRCHSWRFWWPSTAW